jgi:hypothetical protein
VPLGTISFAASVVSATFVVGCVISEPVEASERLLRLLRREGEPDAGLLDVPERVLLQEVGEGRHSAKGSKKARCEVPYTAMMANLRVYQEAEHLQR